MSELDSHRPGRNGVNPGQLVEKVITGSTDQQQYYRMTVPVRWSIDITKNPNTYNGTGFPFSVIIRFTSPDQRSAIIYHSTYFFTDDYLHPYEEETVDDFGVLHASYTGAQDLIAKRGDAAFGSTEHVRVFGTVRDNAYDIYQRKREQAIREYYAQDPLYAVEQVDYENYRREYLFTLNGAIYRGGFCGTTEAVRLARWRVVPPEAAVSLNEPSRRDIILQGFPNIHYDENRRQYLYTSRYGTDVHLYGQFAFYAPLENYEEYFRTIFSPMTHNGVVLCDGLRNEMRIHQDAIDRRNQAVREEKRKIAEENMAATGERMAKGKAFREELHKTAQFVLDSYEMNPEWGKKF